MTETAMVLPVLTGKRQVLNAFAQALMGERLPEYEASQASVLRESWFVQSTPQGDILVAHFEAPDVQAVLSGLAASSEPFDIWFRAQVHDITGVDLALLPAGVNERIFAWRRK